MPRCSDKDTGDYSTPLSLQQVICTAIGIAVLTLGFFGKAQEESRLAYVTVMAVSPQQLHLFFFMLSGDSDKDEKRAYELQGPHQYTACSRMQRNQSMVLSPISSYDTWNHSQSSKAGI